MCYFFFFLRLCGAFHTPSPSIFPLNMMSLEEALDSPNLELHVVVISLIWVLGIKPVCFEEWCF